MSTEIRTLLDEWKKLSAAATPGPWEAVDDDWNDCCAVRLPDDGTWGISYIAEKVMQGHDAGERDAAFIAASRTIVPRLIAAVEAVLELHRPVEVEPSDTICGECSFQLPNGRYFGKVVEWPCPTVAAIRAELIGDDDE